MENEKGARKVRAALEMAGRVLMRIFTRRQKYTIFTGFPQKDASYLIGSNKTGKTAVG